MTDLKELFEAALADPALDRVDVDAAVRRGRRRRAGKKVGVLGTATLAVGVVAAVALSVLPRQTTPVAAPSPSAPTESSAVPAGSTPVPTSSDLVGSWSPSELFGRDLADVLAPATQGAADPAMLYVQFDRADDGGWTLRSHDYCNFVSGTYAVSAGEFRATQLGITQRLCPKVPPALAEAGALNVRALTEADEARFVIDPASGGMDLILLQGGKVIARYVGPSGHGVAQAYLQDSPELEVGRYESSAPVPDADALVGRWQWNEIGGHDLTATSAREDLYFSLRDDGTHVWSGRDGCNGWYGTYSAAEGRFSVLAEGSTLAACSDVNVPAAASILAVTTADEARFLVDSRTNQLTTLLLMKDGRVLARYVQVS